MAKEIIRFYKNKPIKFIIEPFFTYIHAGSLADAININKEEFMLMTATLNLRWHLAWINEEAYLTPRGVNICLQKLHIEDVKIFLKKQLYNLRCEDKNVKKHKEHIHLLSIWKRTPSIIYVAFVGHNEVCVGATDDIVLEASRANFIFSTFRVFDIFEHPRNSLSTEELRTMVENLPCLKYNQQGEYKMTLAGDDITFKTYDCPRFVHFDIVQSINDMLGPAIDTQ